MGSTSPVLNVCVISSGVQPTLAMSRSSSLCVPRTSLLALGIISCIHRTKQLREELRRACDHSDPRLAGCLSLVWRSLRRKYVRKFEVRIDEEGARQAMHLQ